MHAIYIVWDYYLKNSITEYKYEECQQCFDCYRRLRYKSFLWLNLSVNDLKQSRRLKLLNVCCMLSQ